MKIFICASKHCYQHIPPIKLALEKMGHTITVPNSFDAPFKEEEMREKGAQDHIAWKSTMLRLQGEKVAANDAILVVNFEKKGIPNYIGGATFLEVSKAFELNKKIFFYNPLPDLIFKDELIAINPLIINGDLSLVQ